MLVTNIFKLKWRLAVLMSPPNSCLNKIVDNRRDSGKMVQTQNPYKDKYTKKIQKRGPGSTHHEEG